VKPVFTLHAGEALTGEHISRTVRGVNTWVPAKDTGIDHSAWRDYVDRKPLSNIDQSTGRCQAEDHPARRRKRFKSARWRS
jgi:hypothetical protein